MDMNALSLHVFYFFYRKILQHEKPMYRDNIICHMVGFG